MVADINLGIDTWIGRSLEELAAFQARDPKIQYIIQAENQRRVPSDVNYLLRHDVLYSKDSCNYPYWRPDLPTALEVQVIKFVHVSLGHLGTEKCMAEIASSVQLICMGPSRQGPRASATFWLCWDVFTKFAPILTEKPRGNTSNASHWRLCIFVMLNKSHVSISLVSFHSHIPKEILPTNADVFT
ncbi:hypothetical protein L798_11490 [Zootermopsis nevadensis]|uniref:Uncharacterized protein n=1 Tax=Zootermopsis nevadensis TaxID=136037 RepID=A0A067QX05_ZOONE|nr:hypothetical protein L798_11490 [Zootermopsis nevadensis]